MDNILLDLNTKRDRPKIKIDDEMYELYTMQDHSPSVVAKMEKAGLKAQKISKNNSITRAERKKLESMINDSIKLIVRNIPESIINKLDYQQKIQIIEVFTEAVVKKSPSPQRPGQQSPDSSGSMGATH